MPYFFIAVRIAWLVGIGGDIESSLEPDAHSHDVVHSPDIARGMTGRIDEVSSVGVVLGVIHGKADGMVNLAGGNLFIAQQPGKDG